MHGRLASALRSTSSSRRSERTSSSSNSTRIAVETATLKARGLPERLDPRGELKGEVVLGPKPEQRRIDARFEGEVAAIRSRVAGKLDGEDLEATLSARASGVALHALVPALFSAARPSSKPTPTASSLDFPFELSLKSPGGRGGAPRRAARSASKRPRASISRCRRAT